MLKKIIIHVLVLFQLAAPGISAAADESDSGCTQLDEKASGDTVKYSLDAEVNGPVFFKELCAMEMVSFDTSVSVYDYYTAEKISLGKAYFWLDEKNSAAPILAFSSKEAAEKYGAEKDGGSVLEYTALAERMLK